MIFEIPAKRPSQMASIAPQLYDIKRSGRVSRNTLNNDQKEMSGATYPFVNGTIDTSGFEIHFPRACYSIKYQEVDAYGDDRYH